MWSIVKHDVGAIAVDLWWQSGGEFVTRTSSPEINAVVAGIV